MEVHELAQMHSQRAIYTLAPWAAAAAAAA